MPVMLACGTRSRRAGVAPEIAKTGFCATKQIHFHGIRLHLIANRQSGKLPVPTHLWLREGNVHDLTAVRDIADQLPALINLFGDKASADSSFKTELKTNRINL